MKGLKGECTIHPDQEKRVPKKAQEKKPTGVVCSDVTRRSTKRNVPSGRERILRRRKGKGNSLKVGSISKA